MVALMALMSLLALFALAAAPSVQQQTQREREKEAIFRGEQVADAIRSYYIYRGGQGPNSLPTDIDQLLEGIQIPGRTKKLQILRAEAAIDPLSQDGEWRRIGATSDDFRGFVQALMEYSGGVAPQARREFTSMNRSPRVIFPLTTEGPPTRMITTPTAPTIKLENAVVAETPVIDLAMLRKRLCAPRAKVSSSRFSAVYALTMRMPPSDSASRPVRVAVISPRSRNKGLSLVKAKARAAPKVPKTRIVIEVRRQLSQKRMQSATTAVMKLPTN